MLSCTPGALQTVPAAAAQQTTPAAILYADRFPGDDIGAQVNAAIHGLPSISANYSGDAPEHCGTVALSPGRYLQQTTILKPNCVLIEGNGAQLVYRGKSYSIIEAGESMKSPTFGTTAGGIHNLWLNGGADVRKGPDSQSGYAGLMVGGDPSGATPASYGAFAQTNSQLYIEGFQNGIIIGRFSSLTTFLGGVINDNGTGVWYPSNAYGSGEAYSFYGTQMNNNHEQGVRDDACGEIRMHGGSIDYTGGVPGQPFYKGNRYAITGNCIDFQGYGVHFEQDGSPILHAVGGNTTLYGGEVYASAEKGTSPAYVLTEGPKATFASYGTAFFSRHSVTNRVEHEGEGADVLGDVSAPDHVSWSSGKGDPPPTGVCANGSLYSNTAGSAGSTLWVCIVGHWKTVQ
jgi:hypothetical protein